MNPAIAPEGHLRAGLRRSLAFCLLLLFGLLFLAPSARAQFSITRKSFNVFFHDTGNGLSGMYVAYSIRNTSGTDYEDLWVQIGDFSGSTIGLAPNEDGLYHLGPLNSGASRMTFFYLRTTGNTASAQTHTVKVYDTKPPGSSLSSATFSMTSEETIQAQANKVTTTVATPNPGQLGGIVSITVTGQTGTIGEGPYGQILSFTPATYGVWEADRYKLVSTSITLSGGNTGTYTDLLSFTVPNSGNTDYTAVFTFRANGITQVPTAVSPVGYIASGTQIKHTTTSNFSELEPIYASDNEVVLSLTRTPSEMIGGGTVTYTLTFTNTGANDIVLDEIINTLPSSPAAATYQSGSTTYGGSAIGDPLLSGAKLTWLGTFSVTAGSSASLSFQATLPATAGTFTNSAFALIGVDQIDCTLNAADNSPCTASVVVVQDSDGDGIPDLVEDRDGDGNPADDDADADGHPNYLDLDSDGDGIADATEAGSNGASPRATDSDGLPDYLDIDSDADGLPDLVEAQSTAGFEVPSGTDSDGDGLDDAYDADDSSTDVDLSEGLTPYNYDGDATPDYRDLDSDGDNSEDAQEGHDYIHDGTPERTPAGADGDRDGLDNGYENGYAPGSPSNATNGVTDTLTDLPHNGAPGSDVNFRNAAVLPVELTSFTALADAEVVVLSWETASETNNAGFEVQIRPVGAETQEPASRPEDAWETIGFLEGHGTTLEPRVYRHRVDPLAPGRYRFRLKQVDYDGRFEYSPEVEVAVEMPDRFLLGAPYPNPFNPETRFSLMVRQAQQVDVEVFDALGRRVRILFQGEVGAEQARTLLFEAGDLPSGLYLIRAVGETFLATRPVLLQK